MENASVYDELWGSLVFHESAEGVLRKVQLKGRLQTDVVYFDSSSGDYSDALWRRFRFGGKALFANDLILHLEADLNLNEWGSNNSDGPGPGILNGFGDGGMWNGLTDAYAGWNPSDAVLLKVGKHSAPFTLDGATSSTGLIALERSIVAENLWFTTEYFTGIALVGEKSKWKYRVSGYSSAGDRDLDTMEKDVFGSGYFALVSLGRDFGGAGLDTLEVRADYVFNDPDADGNVGTKNLRQVACLVGKVEKGRVGLWADCSAGEGLSGQSDLVGVQLMPFYSFSDTWQLMFRYALVHGLDGSGVRKARYPHKIDSALSETVADYYLGLNCYVYDHKVKWQSGVEYTMATGASAPASDYEGWGISTGLRISW